MQTVSTTHGLTEGTSGQIERELDNLDLDCVKVKLMDPDEGEGWSREKADRMEVEYKRFLYLTAASDFPVVPTKEIDTFWHQHVLDTRKYAQDCQRIFGHFLHHFPYFGMRGEQDAEDLRAAFAETRRLYRDEFGEDYGADASDCENCGSCQASCGVPGNCTSSCGDHRVPDTHTRPSLSPSVLVAWR